MRPAPLRKKWDATCIFGHNITFLRPGAFLRPVVALVLLSQQKFDENGCHSMEFDDDDDDDGSADAQSIQTFPFMNLLLRGTGHVIALPV